MSVATLEKKSSMANRNSFEQLSSTVLAWDKEYNSKIGISEEYFPD